MLEFSFYIQNIFVFLIRIIIMVEILNFRIADHSEIAEPRPFAIFAKETIQEIPYVRVVPLQMFVSSGTLQFSF